MLEFYSSLSTAIAQNWETILMCLPFLFSTKINRNSKTNWVDEKPERLLKAMGGSRIAECGWFQPRLSWWVLFIFFFFLPERKLVTEDDETNWEMVQQTSHVDYNAWPKWERTAVIIFRTTNMKGKEPHPPRDISMMNLAIARVSYNSC